VLFLESSARAWLVVHAIVGAALVASTTHLVVWTWPLLRGRGARYRGVRILATVAATLYVTQFAIGNLLYPVYKVRVRQEYLDEAPAVRADQELRLRVRAAIATGRTTDELDRAGPAEASPPASLRPVARLFDVKEHWVALGLPIALAACALAWAWDPRKSGASTVAGRALFAAAVGATAVAWFAATVGLVVTSYRSVGGLS
jgi:hypothetical protein